MAAPGLDRFLTLSAGFRLVQGWRHETLVTKPRLKAIIPTSGLGVSVPFVLMQHPGFAMLTHNQIWTAIDRLAARAKLTASGLAKKSGLDPTTFNKSKRITPEGRPRWPSTESVSKALAATSTKIDTFIALIT